MQTVEETVIIMKHELNEPKTSKDIAKEVEKNKYMQKEIEDCLS